MFDEMFLEVLLYSTFSVTFGSVEVFVGGSSTIVTVNKKILDVQYSCWVFLQKKCNKK